MPTNRVVIVGAGASGIFTAYRLREMYGDKYEIALLEANDRIGGNCYSTHVEYGGKDYSIDCGAQFFYKNPQPSYTALLDQLGLLDSATEVVGAPAGFTIYDKPTNNFRLWLPSRVVEFLGYDAGDWERLVQFLEYLAYSAALDREAPNWELSVDDWFAKMKLLSDDFKEKVIKPFMYQFVSLPLSRIGEASALYAVTYFIRNILGEPGVPEPDVDPPNLPAIPTFTTYQSMIGLDGIHKKVMDAAKVVPFLSCPVTKVERVGDVLQVTSAIGMLEADHVVFSCDPHAAAKILQAGNVAPAPLLDTLNALEYAKLPISMQKDGSCWMPPNDDDWEPVNTIVDGESVTFTAWFGRLRPTYGLLKRIPVFKSWGAPAVAGCPHEFLAHQHYIPYPTTTFMKHREKLKGFQGQNGVWFVGGWTTWFDSQEAALDSATAVAEALPAEKKPGTGLERMVGMDPQRIQRNLRRFAERVARVAPDQHKAAIANVIEKVAEEG